MNSVMSSRLKESLGISDSSEDTDNKIASLFGIEGGEDSGEDFQPPEPPKFELKEVESTVPDLVSTDAKVDYVMARNITHTLLELTGDALAGALKVAKDSEHPRAFGIFNELVGTMRDLTQDLLGMQKIYREITKDRPETINVIQNNTQINGANTVAVGAPQGASDMLRLLEVAKEQLREIELEDED